MLIRNPRNCLLLSTNSYPFNRVVIVRFHIIRNHQSNIKMSSTKMCHIECVDIVSSGKAAVPAEPTVPLQGVLP